MLYDPDINHNALIELLSDEGFSHLRLHQGLYQIPHFNFNLMLKHYHINGYPLQPIPPLELTDPNDRIKWLLENSREDFFDFGVADSPEQIIEKFPDDLKYHPLRLFVISTTHIPKNSGETDGWRWHKWGEYIGDGEPTCEYLSDEPEFDDGVWVFHVYEILGEK